MRSQKISLSNVGWVGTGRMGFAMAERIVDAGYELIVWKRTQSKAKPLERKGAKLADKLQDLGRCDIVFLIADSYEAARL